MDQLNTFDTPTTARLHRLEYGAALALTTGLLIANWDGVRFWTGLLLFAYIDIIGYIPGAIAFHYSKDGRISKVYYVLYNTMHSWLSMGAVAALWAYFVKPEWTLLVIPLHMCIDRSIFGNQLKPFSVPFEPKRLPAFERLLAGLTPVPVSKPTIADTEQPVPAATDTEQPVSAAAAPEPVAVGAREEAAVG